MSSLVIADTGLNIKGLSKTNASVPSQVLSLSISDGVIEEMIKCVQNDISIQLSLEDNPSISYGSSTQHLSISNDTSSHEVFRTSIPNAIRVSSKAPIPHPPPNAFANVKMTSTFAAMIGQNLIAKTPPVVHSTTSGSALLAENSPETAGTDAALAALQSSLASESIRKAENTVKYIKDGSLTIPKKRGAAAKSLNQSNARSQKHLVHDSSKTSMPRSPSSGSFSSIPLSQQQAEQAKATRKPVIHLLAVTPLSQDDLEAQIPESTANGLKQALEKVGDWNQSTAKWELRKAFYKELDVWNFKYENPQNRQKAIDNAVRVFDKMRINVSEPQWERLLPLNQRGTGKCLSKLQAQIAQASSQKAPNKSSDSGRDSPSANSGTGGSASVGHCSNSSTSREDGTTGEKAATKTKGESTVRTKSNTSATSKMKKMTSNEKEPQSKRIITKKAPAGGKSSTTMAKNTGPKKSQNVTNKDAKTTSHAALSSEYVHSSDEDSPSKVASPVAKQRKRPRGNDEVENSESSTSPPKKANRDISLPHRSSDGSQNTTMSHHNSSQSSLSSKSTKSNSPQKSSPLASSPPTNASDLEESSSSHSPISPSSSPRSTTVSRSPIQKTQRKTCPVSRQVANGVRRLRPEVTDLARKYKMYYPKYLQLHEQITGMGGRRDRRMEKDLLEMHARLYAMKKEIQAGIVDVDRC